MMIKIHYKKILLMFVLFLAISLSVFAVPTEYPHANNPMGAVRVFHMDETSGTTVEDSLGNGDGFALNTEDADWEAGYINNQLNTDASSEAFDLQYAWSLNNAFAFSFWWNSTTITAAFIGDRGASQNEDVFYFTVTTNDLKVSCGDEIDENNDHGTWYYKGLFNSSGPTLNDGKPHHFLFQKDAGPCRVETFHLFIDGVLIIESSVLRNNGALNHDFDTMFIGGNGNAVYEAMAIDEVIVFDRNLTGAEVLQLNNTDFQGDETAPTFDEIPQNDTLEYYYETLYKKINASDDVAVYNFSVNDTANFNITFSGELRNKTLLPVGTYDLNVTVFDEALNQNQTMLKITVTDTIGPAVSIIYPLNNSFLNTNDIHIDGISTDASGVYNNIINDSKFTINGSGNHWKFSNNTALEEIKLWFNVTANDTNDNIANGFVYFTLDYSAPVFDEIPQNDTLEYYYETYYKKINASGNVANFTVSDTANFNITFSGELINNTLLPIGTYYLDVTVFDTANNGNKVNLEVIAVDTKSPTILITYPANDTYLNDVHINGISIDVSGLDNVLINDTKYILSLRNTVHLSGYDDLGNVPWNNQANFEDGDWTTFAAVPTTTPSILITNFSVNGTILNAIYNIKNANGCKTAFVICKNFTSSNRDPALFNNSRFIRVNNINTCGIESFNISLPNECFGGAPLHTIEVGVEVVTDIAGGINVYESTLTYTKIGADGNFTFINNTALAEGKLWFNITVKDSYDNTNSTIIFFNLDYTPVTFSDYDVSRFNHTYYNFSVTLNETNPPIEYGFQYQTQIAGSSFLEGIVGYWNFSDNQANRDVLDSTGNWTLNATGDTSSLHVTDCILDGCFDFVDTYVIKNNTMNYLALYNHTTVNFWAKTDSPATSEDFIIFRKDNNNKISFRKDVIQTGNYGILVVAGGSINLNTDIGVPMAQTTFEMMTYIINTTGHYVYRNGTYVYSHGEGTQLEDIDANEFIVGGNYPAGAYSAATMDEVGLWHRTLTPSEIMNLYKNISQGFGYDDFIGGVTGIEWVTVFNSTTSTENVSILFEQPLGYNNLTYRWYAIDDAGNLNYSEIQNLIFLDAEPTINNITISPNYPYYTEDLVCGFNVTDNNPIELNASVTWYKNQTGSWENVPTYDYTFKAITSNASYTTGIGTGSVTEELANYSHWKCEVFAFNFLAGVYENSSVVNVYPLENLTLISPDDNYISNDDLNVTFNVIDFDGGIVCNLSINDTGLSIVSANSGVDTNLSLPLANNGHYEWNLSCDSIGSIPVVSENRNFIFDNRSPIYLNFTDNSTATFPEINDTINLSIVVYDLNNVDVCKLEVNTTGVWVNDSIYDINVANSTLTMLYTIPVVGVSNNSYIGWRVWCNDTVDNINTSSVQLFIVVDTTLPIISIGNNNGFNEFNTSIITKRVENLTINLTFADWNLFQASLNISCDVNKSLFYWEVLDVNTTEYNLFDSVDLRNQALQKCSAHISSSDDHTKRAITPYVVRELSDGLEFKTDVGITTRITTGAGLSDVSAKKEVDRYVFNFRFSKASTKHTFTLTSDYKLHPRNSGYTAHFVSWNPELKQGNWIDFEEFNNIKDWSIKKINDYEYFVTINTNNPISNLQFNSIGGTNVYNITYDFYIGGSVNISGINVYGNTTISNYTLTIFDMSVEGPWNVTTFNITGKQAYINNISNGTYRFVYGKKDSYFNKTYIVVVNDTLNHALYETYESEIWIEVTNAKTGIAQTDLNITLTKLDTSIITIRENSVTFLTPFYINASTYDALAQKTGYVNVNDSFNISKVENATLTLVMPFIASFTLFDELTEELFNVSSPETIRFLLFCPGETIMYVVDSETTAINISCDYEKFKFTLDYITDSYYRTFIIEPEDVFNMSIYLIDLATTSAIYNSFILDDLLQDYDNPSVYVKKIIGVNTVQITSNEIDMENKIGVYLIENHEYIVEVHSNNRPIRVMGVYSADLEGEKVLRLYDISLDTNPIGFTNLASYMIDTINISDDRYAVAIYEDLSNQTTSVTFTVYQDLYSGTVLFTDSVSSSYNDTMDVEFQFNITEYLDSTIIAVLNITYNGENLHTGRTVNKVTGKEMDILKHLQPGFMNWFITIMLAILAIYSTSRTGNFIALGILALAGLLSVFGWYGISVPIIAIGAIIAIISILKTGSKND